MSQTSDFKKLARKAYLSYHQDGLIDLFIGWVALCFGLDMAFDTSVWLFLGWFPILFYVQAKNRLTVPRLGYVKFDEKHSRTRWMLAAFLALGVLMLLVVGALVLLLSDQTAPPALLWVRANGWLVYGILAALLFSMGGLVSAIQRLYAYALLALALAFSGHWLALPDFAAVIALGVIILAMGALLMLRFVRRYPIAPEE